MVNDPSDSLLALNTWRGQDAQGKSPVFGDFAAQPVSTPSGEVAWVPTKTQMWTACGIAAAALGFAICAFSMAFVVLLKAHQLGWL